MPSAIKAAKLADQIRDYVAVWFIKDFPNSFISIDQVTLSTNMLIATVWITNSSIKPIKQSELSLKKLEYQKKLSAKLNRRTVPKIEFRTIN